MNTLLKPLGFPPEKEAFVPHITLARVKSSRNLSNLAFNLLQQPEVYPTSPFKTFCLLSRPARA
ncbi:MAG: hypothetical protein DRJ97_07885 [Thermoprotei archaeon]|nr:MAG: hypothetical protein DRJ97_07885 [Thermoprotei archaeon]